MRGDTIMISASEIHELRFEKAAFGYKQEDIDEFLNKLEEEGDAIWQLRMADELLPTANAWREDCELPTLSRSLPSK